MSSNPLLLTRTVDTSKPVRFAPFNRQTETPNSFTAIQGTAEVTVGRGQEADAVSLRYPWPQSRFASPLFIPVKQQMIVSSVMQPACSTHQALHPCEQPRLLRQGKPDACGGIALVGSHTATVREHEFFDNCQSEPRPARLFGRKPSSPKEAIENEWQVGVVDALAVVRNNKSDRVAHLADHNIYVPSGGRVLDSVLQQVSYRLDDPIGVCANFPGSPATGESDIELFGLDRRPAEN